MIPHAQTTAAFSILAAEQTSMTDSLMTMMGWIASILIILTVGTIGWKVFDSWLRHGGGGGTRIVYRDRPEPKPTPRHEPATKPRSAPSKSETARTWKQADTIRSEVRDAQAEWEFDLAEQIFYRPLLGEPTEPLTGAWLDALARMDEVFPESEPRDFEVADRCLTVAQMARAAWRAADAHARKVGLGQLSPEHKKSLDTARKLLAAAADPGTVDEERRGQVEKVIDILVAITSRPKSKVSAQVQSRLNVKLRELDIPPLRLAITQGPAR